MPNVIDADLFAPQSGRYVLTATTNGAATNRLIMGAGAARELLTRFPGLDADAAMAIRNTGMLHGDFWQYGFVVVENHPHPIGLFQTKYDWSGKSDLKLIEYSCAKLCEWLCWNPGWNIRMNYPGIGLGGLHERQVWPLLQDLPESVTICKR